jgi:hypothetical protein
MYLYEVIKSLGFRFRKEMKKQNKKIRNVSGGKQTLVCSHTVHGVPRISQGIKLGAC